MGVSPECGVHIEGGASGAVEEGVGDGGRGGGGGASAWRERVAMRCGGTEERAVIVG